MDKSLIQIQTLHPKLREAALAAYSEAVKETPVGIHPVINQGLRTFAESDALYALGRTKVNPDGKSAKKPFGNIVSNARAGQSWHNYGLAVDFYLEINGKAVWKEKHPSWIDVVQIFKSHGFGWGGDWRSIKDYPHFDKTFGLTIGQALAKYNKKDFIPGTTYIKI